MLHKGNTEYFKCFEDQVHLSLLIITIAFQCRKRDFQDSRLQLPLRAWPQALPGSVKQFLILQEELCSFSTNQDIGETFLQPRLPAITGSAKHISDFEELCSFRHQGLRENWGSALLPIGSFYLVGKEVGATQYLKFYPVVSGSIAHGPVVSQNIWLEGYSGVKLLT